MLVVGGGPAGVTAAVQARHMDAAVTLLEADQVGGTNLNRGPAPVRTMARSARLARDWTSWSVFGLEGPAPKPNLQAILANSDRVARHVFEKKHLADQLRRHGINLVEHLGPVQFTDPHTLEPRDGRSWRADHIILAVGGHAGRLPIPGNELALTYSDIRTLKVLPAADGRHRRCRHGMPNRFHPRRPWQPRQPVRGYRQNSTARRPQHLDRTRSSIST